EHEPLVVAADADAEERPPRRLVCHGIGRSRGELDRERHALLLEAGRDRRMRGVLGEEREHERLAHLAPPRAHAGTQPTAPAPPAAGGPRAPRTSPRATAS